jgi:hypothetical protein
MLYKINNTMTKQTREELMEKKRIYMVKYRANRRKNMGDEKYLEDLKMKKRYFRNKEKVSKNDCLKECSQKCKENENEDIKVIKNTREDIENAILLLGLNGLRVEKVEVEKVEVSKNDDRNKRIECHFCKKSFLQKNMPRHNKSIKHRKNKKNMKK